MFGRRLSDYARFHTPVLVALAVVGLARLGLSIAGVPDTTVRWVSMNIVMWAGAIYAGVAVHARGFGSYKQLLPLVGMQTVLFQCIAVLGILLAIVGVGNIFAAPEYSFGAQSQGVHALAHLTIGLVVPILLLWGVASLVLWISRRVVRQPAAAVHDAGRGLTR